MSDDGGGSTARPSGSRVTIGLVSGGHLLSHFYLLAFPPLFPLLGSASGLGLSNTQLGLLVSALSAASLLQMPVGELVDRVGAKTVLVPGTALTAAGIALSGLAPSYPVMLGAAALSGIGQSAFHPADYAILEAVTEADAEGKSFSVHTFAGYVGFAAAPVVVGSIGLARGWRTALVAVGAVGVVYAAVLAVALAPHHRRRTDADDGAGSAGLHESLAALVSPAILAMAAFFVLFSIGNRGVQSFTTVLVTDSFGLGESLGNTVLTALFVCQAAGILVGGGIADRLPPGRVIAGGMGLAAVSLLAGVSGLVTVDTVRALALFGAVGFFAGIAYPSRDRLVSDLASGGSMGKSFGFVFTAGAAGSLVGPALLGAVIDATAVALAFGLVGLLYLVPAGIALAVGERTAPRRSGG